MYTSDWDHIVLLKTRQPRRTGVGGAAVHQHSHWQQWGDPTYPEVAPQGIDVKGEGSGPPDRAAAVLVAGI